MKTILFFVSFNFLLSTLYAQIGSVDTTGNSPWEYFGQDNVGKTMRRFVFAKTGINSADTALFKGKISFINFWFEGCEPCIAEFKALNQLFLNYRKNPHFQFFSYTWEKPEKIAAIRRKYNLKFPIISIEDSLIRIMNFQSGYPCSIITDSDAVINKFYTGGTKDPEQSIAFFKDEVYPKINLLLATFPATVK